MRCLRPVEGIGFVAPLSVGGPGLFVGRHSLGDVGLGGRNGAWAKIRATDGIGDFVVVRLLLVW